MWLQDLEVDLVELNESAVVREILVIVDVSNEPLEDADVAVNRYV